MFEGDVIVCKCVGVAGEVMSGHSAIRDEVAPESRGVMSAEEFAAEILADHHNERTLFVKEICVLVLLVAFMIFRSWILS